MFHAILVDPLHRKRPQSTSFQMPTILYWFSLLYFLLIYLSLYVQQYTNSSCSISCSTFYFTFNSTSCATICFNQSSILCSHSFQNLTPTCSFYYTCSELLIIHFKHHLQNSNVNMSC